VPAIKTKGFHCEGFERKQKMSRKYISQYIKRNVDGRLNQKVGLVVAVKDGENSIRYGWSLAKVAGKGKHDSFDKATAIRTCFDRINNRAAVPMPFTVEKALRDRNVETKIKEGGRTKRVSVKVDGLAARAQKYFFNPKFKPVEEVK